MQHHYDFNKSQRSQAFTIIKKKPRKTMPSVLTYQPRKTIIPNQLKEWNRMTKGDSKEIRKDRV